MRLIIHPLFSILAPLILTNYPEAGLANPLISPTPPQHSDPSQQQRLGSPANADHPDDRVSSSTAPLSATPSNSGGVSATLFSSLERMARLVDITYCVGTTGVSKPFSCASRCKDFPSLVLERTWNTGMLMSDSCGYIAVDHGESRSRATDFEAAPTVDDDDLTATTETTAVFARTSGMMAEPSIVVAFRGTYSIANTIVDLSTVPQEYVPYPAPGDGDGDGDDGAEKKDNGNSRCSNCTVHMGFLSSWRAAREVVLPALKSARARHPSYPVHLVGHSLGGAVAALAALELRLSLGWEDVMVTTFGEPRVGNAALVAYLDAAFGYGKNGTDVGGKGNGASSGGEDLPYRRVTHVDDPVPLLPLSEWGYRSHAGEVFISKADLQPAPEDLRLCRGDNDPNCSGGAEKSSSTSPWIGRGRGWLGWLGGRVRGHPVRKQDDAAAEVNGFPTRLKLWQLLFAHRDYFWRLGLCLPGGDPADWGRDEYTFPGADDDVVNVVDGVQGQQNVNEDL